MRPRAFGNKFAAKEQFLLVLTWQTGGWSAFSMRDHRLTNLMVCWYKLSSTSPQTCENQDCSQWMSSTQYNKKLYLMSWHFSWFIYLHSVAEYCYFKLELKNQSVLSSQFLSRNDDYECEEHTFLLHEENNFDDFPTCYWKGCRWFIGWMGKEGGNKIGKTRELIKRGEKLRFSLSYF